MLVKKDNVTPIWLFGILSIFVLALSRFLATSNAYPYYFMWDMDHTTTLDALLIQSGQLPDHIHHPNFGMYLFLNIAQKMSYALGHLSALTMEDMAQSLNPMGVLAEQVQFVRSQNPYLAVSIIFFLWSAICLLMRPGKWQALGLLFYISLLESLTYQASQVRSEQYALFFWAIAICLLGKWSRTDMYASRWRYGLACGLFLGLCFLTKLQALFYLAAFPLLLMLAMSKAIIEPEKGCKVDKLNMIMLALVNALIFTILILFARYQPIHEGAATFTKSYGLSPITFLAGIVVFGVPAYQLWCYRKNRVGDFFRISEIVTLLILGFFGAFLCHFLIYDPATSWDYLLVNFKMLFLRGETAYASGGLVEYLTNIKDQLAYQPMLYTANVLLLVWLTIGFRKRFIEISKQQYLILLTLSGLAFVNGVFAARPLLRDTIWVEMLYCVVNSILLFWVLTKSTRRRRAAIALCGLLATLLFIAEQKHLSILPSRMDAEYNHYGWFPQKMTRHVYKGNQRYFTELMVKHYDAKTIRLGLKAASHEARDRRYASFVFFNRQVTGRELGVAAAGFPVWIADLGWRVAVVPEQLAGVLVIDVGHSAIKHDNAMVPNKVKRSNTDLDKLTKMLPQRLAILTRPDLEILIFLHPVDFPSLLEPEQVDSGLTIVLKKGEQHLEYKGMRIDNYSELALQKLRYPLFATITSRTLGKTTLKRR